MAGLTQILYEAREKALSRIEQDAERCGADEVVGVKTHVYDLGGGLIEFMAIGTAVKKVEGVKTRVMTAEHLVALALKTGRAKDYARILQFIEAGAIETDRLNPILGRHQLLEKWEKFGVKFLKNE